MFGPCSPEVAATASAWYAVGVGGLYSSTVVSDFTSNNTTMCSVPALVNFTNNSSNGVNFIWNFGDGTTSTQSNPVHTYTSFGIYSVKLITYGGTCGTDSITKNNFININASNICPIPIPTLGSITQTTCTGLLVDDGGASANYSTNSNGMITLAPVGATQITLTFSSFDFEDYYDYLNVYAGPNISSPSIGSYTGLTLPGGGTLVINSGVVTIQQTSDSYLEKAGFQLSWQCSYVPVPPVANFVADSTISCSGNVSFTDLSTNSPTSWLWDFGDGSASSSLQNPVHFYASNGSYSVSLQATNGVGSNTYYTYNYINVNSAYCNGLVMPAGSGAGGTQTSCVGVLYDNGGIGANYSDNTNSTIIISPVAATQITLNFSLFDFEDGYDFIEIYDGAVISPSALLGHYTGYSLPGGGSLTFYTGTITILQHSDAYVVGQGFIIDWSCSNVPNYPVASLWSDSTSSCMGLLHFYDQSSGSPTSWLWSFGDGGTSNLQNPTHQYTSNGNYDVSLQVTNGSGSDTYNAINYIHVNDAICSSVSMPTTGYGSNITSCSGVLADNGGVTGNYSNYTNSIITIVPFGANQITLNFSLFDLESNYDSLFIYAGPSIASPLLGGYTGYSLPAGGLPIVVNAPSVTIKQTSDYSVNYAGFEMSWSCSSNIGIKDNEGIQNDMLIYPNPAHDAVTIMYSSENNNLVSVKLSDALGDQLANLVLDNPMNQMYKKTIDLSSFSNGVYFVEIKDGLRTITQKFVLIK